MNATGTDMVFQICGSQVMQGFGGKQHFQLSLKLTGNVVKQKGVTASFTN